MVVERISKSTVSALGKNARRRGLTVDAYLKALVAEDIELDRLARTKTFAELTIPFQKALAHLSELDLDALARPKLANGRRGPSKRSRIELNGDKIQALLRKLRYFGDYHHRRIRVSFPFARDPTDAKLIELAIESHATHIVTYDADLLSLPGSPGDAGKRFRQRLRSVEVVRPEELIRQIPENFRQR